MQSVNPLELVLNAREKRGLLSKIKTLWDVVVRNDIVVSNGQVTIRIQGSKLSVEAECIVFKYKLLFINCEDDYVSARIEEAKSDELFYETLKLTPSSEEEELSAPIVVENSASIEKERKEWTVCEL